jgi:hypothetical protein
MGSHMAEIVLLAIGIAVCLGIIVRDAQEFAVLAHLDERHVKSHGRAV